MINYMQLEDSVFLLLIGLCQVCIVLIVTCYQIIPIRAKFDFETVR